MALSQGVICTKRVHLGLTEVAFIEGCPHVRGGLYEGLHRLTYLVVILKSLVIVSLHVESPGQLIAALCLHSLHLCTMERM